RIKPRRAPSGLPFRGADRGVHTLDLIERRARAPDETHQESATWDRPVEPPAAAPATIERATIGQVHGEMVDILSGLPAQLADELAGRRLDPAPPPPPPPAMFVPRAACIALIRDDQLVDELAGTKLAACDRGLLLQIGDRIEIEERTAAAPAPGRSI